MKKLFLLPLTFYGIFCSVLVPYSMNPDHTNEGSKNFCFNINSETIVPVIALAKSEEQGIRIEVGKIDTGGYRFMIVRRDSIEFLARKFDESCEYYEFSEECGLLKVKEKGNYTFVFINIQDKDNPIKFSEYTVTKEKNICLINPQYEGFACVQQENRWNFVYFNLERFVPIGESYEDIGEIHLIKENECLAYINKNGTYKLAFIKLDRNINQNNLNGQMFSVIRYDLNIEGKNITKTGKIFFADEKYALTWVQTDDNEYKFIFVDCEKDLPSIEFLDIKFKMIKDEDIRCEEGSMEAKVIDEEGKDKIITLDPKTKTYGT